MSISTEKIRKVTSKGQITLPASWRKNLKSDYVLVKSKENIVEIVPIKPSQKCECGEYTVFDALRDNKGRGIKASGLLKILNRIESGK